MTVTMFLLGLVYVVLVVVLFAAGQERAASWSSSPAASRC